MAIPKNPKAGGVYSVDPSSLIIIGLDTEDGVSHPLYDERVHLPLPETFLANLSHLGVKSPVPVRIVGEQAIVIDGRQRVRAAREINQRRTKAGEPTSEIPVIIEKVTDSIAVEAMISLNVHRQNDDAVTLAEKALRALHILGSKEALCRTLGVSEPQANRLLRFAEKATAALKQAVRDGYIAPTTAYNLASQPPEEQDEAAKVARESGVQANTNAQGKVRPAGTKGRGARPNSGVKHSIGRRWLSAKTVQPPPEYAPVLAWLIAGTPLPEDHPLRDWAEKADAETAKKPGGKPGKKADPAKAAAREQKKADVAARKAAREQAKADKEATKEAEKAARKADRAAAKAAAKAAAATGTGSAVVGAPAGTLPQKPASLDDEDDAAFLASFAAAAAESGLFDDDENAAAAASDEDWDDDEDDDDGDEDDDWDDEDEDDGDEDE